MTKEEVIEAINRAMADADLMIEKQQADGLPTVTAETHLIRAKKTFQVMIDNREFDDLTESELQSLYYSMITLVSRFNHN